MLLVRKWYVTLCTEDFEFEKCTIPPADSGRRRNLFWSSFDIGEGIWIYMSFLFRFLGNTQKRRLNLQTNNATTLKSSPS